MTRRTKFYTVLIIVLVGVSMLAAGSQGGRSPMPRRPETSSAEVDPYQNCSVLVEAFVVEVDLSLLYRMNMSPLGRAPHSVSVENILECLKASDKAHVLVGAKATAGHRSNRNTAKRSETTYLAIQRIHNTPGGPKETVDYDPYENGEILTIAPVVLSEQMVGLNYSFSYSGPRGTGPERKGPVDTVSWSWNGNVSLTAGEPGIVGATQDQKAAVFFILTAHILD